MPEKAVDHADYRAFLAQRARAFSRNQPEFRELRRILLSVGGEELVPPLQDDPVTGFLVDYGIVFSGPILVKTSRSSEPADALGKIWRRRLHGIVGLGVGYALGGDRLWREHSFGVLREGVLETSDAKEKYFGLLLIGQAADRLAAGSR